MSNRLDNYNKTNFIKLVEQRKDGVTEQTFMEDVSIYQEAINSLPAYSEEVFRKEINQMDLGVPDNEYDFKEVQKIYSRLVAYRFRIAEMISVVNAHHDMFEKAYKSLFKIAVKLIDGTAKDKDAYAENRVQPFAIGVLNTDSFLKYLIEVKDAIEFAAMNMARILREKEALLQINKLDELDGAMYNFESNKEIGKNQEDTIYHEDSIIYYDNDGHVRKKIE